MRLPHCLCGLAIPASADLERKDLVSVFERPMAVICLTFV